MDEIGGSASHLARLNTVFAAGVTAGNLFEGTLQISEEFVIFC